MGQTTDHALGRSIKGFMKTETTFGTFAKPAATNAFKLKALQIDAKQERKDRDDNRTSRSVLERITGKKEVSYSLEAYVLPSGSLGVAPNLGPAFKAAFGTETVNASTSVVYSLSAGQALGSLSIVREMNAAVMEAAFGAWVESLTLKVQGGEPPMLSMEGGASDYAHTGTGTLGAILNAAATTATITAADILNFQAGSVVAFGADNNTSAGYQVTVVNTATNVITFTPGAAVGAANGAAVTPFVPSETTVGSQIAGVLGSLTIDAVAVPITGFELSLKNNIKAIGDEFGTALVTDYIPGQREVTGTINLRARKDQILHLGKRWGFATRDLAVTCGTVAGKKLIIDVNYAEIEFAPLEVPDVEEATIQLPFKALASAGEDEVTATLI